MKLKTEEIVMLVILSVLGYTYYKSRNPDKKDKDKDKKKDKLSKTQQQEENAASKKNKGASEKPQNPGKKIKKDKPHINPNDVLNTSPVDSSKIELTFPTSSPDDIRDDLVDDLIDAKKKDN